MCEVSCLGCVCGNLRGVCGILKAASSAWFTREEGLRKEIARLEDRIHDLEEEKGELVASTSDNTRPLIRSATALFPSAILGNRASLSSPHRLGP